MLDSLTVRMEEGGFGAKEGCPELTYCLERRSSDISIYASIYPWNDLFEWWYADVLLIRFFARQHTLLHTVHVYMLTCPQVVRHICLGTSFTFLEPNKWMRGTNTVYYHSDDHLKTSN